MNRIREKQILKELKADSGSHSPSTKEIEFCLGYNPIKHDFCFLSNPYATDLVVDALHSMLSDRNIMFGFLESYPASSKYVSKNIAEFEGLNPEFVVVGNGAVQAIEWVCEGWGLQRLLIPIPTFSTYYEFLGDKCVFTDELWLGGNVTASNLLNLADKYSSDSILLIYPNNPTGEAISLDELKSLTAQLGGRKLIIDESFSHFTSSYQDYSEFRNSLCNENIVFIKSMSKDFGVAGLRLGYLYAFDQSLLSFANKKTTWNLNNFSVAFSDLLANMSFKERYLEARKSYIDAREEFYIKLKQLPEIDVYPSEANFFLIKIRQNAYPDIVYDLLIDYGIYVRTMEDKIGLSDSYIRVASRRHEDNLFFINCLVEYFCND